MKDTLVLVHNSFNKTFGGYTHYPWKSIDSWGEYVHDSGRKTFLFSLDNEEKYVPQGNKHLILNLDVYGPTFGSGNDFCIVDRCN